MSDPFDLCRFGLRLRAARYEAGLSQAALATQMRVAQSWLSDLENARQTHVQADTVYRLCQALGTSADWLLGLDDPSPGSPVAADARPMALGEE